VKRVLTVLGPVPPEALGPTMTHEHLLVDLRAHWHEPETLPASMRARKHAPVTPDLLAELLRFPFTTTLDNLVLADEDIAVKELSYFQRAGGSAIVDLTSIGLARDARALYRIARTTGLHIVMGGGCYTDSAHPSWVRLATVEELAERFADDVLVGVDGTAIRSGIIGEVGISGIASDDPARRKRGHMTPDEQKVLRAAGRAAADTGVCVSVHVDLRSQGAHVAIDVLEAEGLPACGQIMCHIDFVDDLDYQRSIMDRGATIEYSSMGREYYEDASGLSWGNDERRIGWLQELVAQGYAERIVLSQDVCMKMDLRTYGGNGYGHVLTAVVDRMLRQGIPAGAIETMLVHNPRRILAVDLDEARLAAMTVPLPLTVPTAPGGSGPTSGAPDDWHDRHTRPDGGGRRPYGRIPRRRGQPLHLRQPSGGGRRVGVRLRAGRDRSCARAGKPLPAQRI
jgi:phosphotriesterase-related protein